MTQRFSPQRLIKVWGKTGGRCWYCGKQTITSDDSSWFKGHPDRFTIDHFIPMCVGGTHHLDNLMPCCFTCNMTKGTRTVEQFRTLLTNLSLPISFSCKQLEYLDSIGVVWPNAKRPVFYYEERHHA